MPVSRPLAALQASAHGFDGFPLPYWSAQGAVLYLGDVRAYLRAMPTRSVHCVVTSPPYWGLRDYGTATWEGGSTNCDHSSARVAGRAESVVSAACQVQANNPHAGFATYRRSCPTCGANRVDMQLGAETSPDCGTHGQAQCGACFVCSMVGVFREVYRVLRDNGTLWLNLGDSYSSGGNVPGGSEKQRRNAEAQRSSAPRRKIDIPPGNLVGVPWRVALALQADGWVLRQDIIWAKKSPMPESVQNRCTKSHEYVFLFAKQQQGYYCDMEAIKEEGQPSSVRKNAKPHNEDSRKDGTVYGKESHASGTRTGTNLCNAYSGVDFSVIGRNKRSVWTVASHGYPGAHFAVYPTKLIEPMILAGTSECGCCAACGAPYERVVVNTTVPRTAGGGHFGRVDPPNGWDMDSKLGQHRQCAEDSCCNTIGWRKVCGCRTDEVVPAIVLDPFVGSGTTVATAVLLGRAGVGIDLSETYLRENAVPRVEAAIRGERVSRKPTFVVKRGKPPTPERVF